MYGLIAEGHFDAAHFLADYHGKCENLHGHRWRVEVTVESQELGQEGTERSMVADFGRFKRSVAAVCDEFDHRMLVEQGTLKPTTIQALESEGFALEVLPFRTTAENLAHEIFCRLEAKGLPVVQVEVDETPANRAFYRR